MSYTTTFGSLDDYRKGEIDLIDDDPRRYAFSNIFEVASNARPYEKIAVGQNRQYVVEAIRAEGTSEWRTAPHDEFALVMDGEVEILIQKLGPGQGPSAERGSNALEGDPGGAPMGRVVARRGHMTLLPVGAAYRFRAAAPAVIMLQTQEGPDTQHRWAEIDPDHALTQPTPSPDSTHPNPEVTAMSIAAPSLVQASGPNANGYRAFSLGEFRFSRDEYFAYVEWPTGRHVMSADTFLKALQRDVAWQFFYGIVNFDGVLGTVNHYGTVDLFAGRYNDAYRKAELDHQENFETSVIKATFEEMLDDWTNDGFDPFAAPTETGSAFGNKRGDNRAAITRHRVTASRMVGVQGDEGLRDDANGHPVNRQFADVPQDEPEIRIEPGHEGEIASFNLFAYLSRSPVTWNPSVVSVCGDSLYCPTTEEYILPIIHGNDRVEWFIQLSDEMIWHVEDRDTGAARAKVVMRPGDVAAMPADIRHQGYAPKRSMLLVWENADPELPALISSGQLPSVPVQL